MGIGGAVGALDLLVRVIGDTKGLDDVLDKSTGKVNAFGKSFDLGGVAKLGAIAGVAGVAAVAIGDMTAAAAADRDEQAKLEQAVRAAGAATGDYVAQLDAAIAAGQAKAFSDTESRDALQSLVTATGDVALATDQLTIAQDLARFANVDLATAADAVAKANAGQDGALRKLVPGLEKGATATDTLAAASKAAAGQADLYAASAEGMQARAGDSLGELSETIGSVFLPILDAIIPALLPILDAFGQLVKALLPVLIPLIKVLAGALKIVADVLVTVVGWLVKLVDWISQAAAKVGEFLDKLNPLKDFKMPSLPFIGGTSAPLPRAVSLAGGVGRAGGESFGVSSGGRGAVTFNFYTTGDSIEQEQAVMRALRRVQRLNAGLVLPAAGRTA